MIAQRQRLEKLEQKTAAATQPPSPALDLIRANPSAVMTLAGLKPDQWQESVLASQAAQMLLLCSRQVGKSTTAAALALETALIEPLSLILLLSPTLRQSGELFRKVTGQYRALGRPVATARQTELTLELANGSRIVSLPESEANIRGYSGVRMLVIDEASRVADALYLAVRPMLAVSRGRLVALSTPFGQRGWFFDAWKSAEPWDRVKITAMECPRISPEFLAEERVALGERWFRQEYECSFEDAIDAVFSAADITAAMSGDVKPLF